MKICLVTPEFPPHHGGIGRSVLRIGTGLARYSGHEVHVAAFDTIWWYKDAGPLPPGGEQVGSTSEGGLIVHRVVGGTDEPSNSGERTYTWLDRLHREYDFDLLVAFNLAYVAFPVTLFAVERGLPVVVSARGLDIGPHVFLPGVYSHMRFALTHANRVHAINREALRRMQVVADLGGRGAVIPSHIDPELFEDGTADLDRSRYRTVIGTAALYRKFKGFDVLLEAVTRLRNPEIAVLYIGDAHPLGGRSLQEVVDAYRGRIPVIVTGIVPHSSMLRYMRAADIFAVPSTHEGGPNVLIEAMLAGRPIVTTAIGQAPDTLRNGIDALIVPSGSPEAMAAALQRLMSRPEEAQRLGANAQRVATQDLSPRREAAAWDALLRSARGEERMGPSAAGDSRSD